MKPDAFRASKCSSCGAKIIWARTEKNRMMPVDFEEQKGSTVYLVPDPDPREPPMLVILPKDGRNLNVRTSHFQTCPQAAQHKTKGLKR